MRERISNWYAVAFWCLITLPIQFPYGGALCLFGLGCVALGNRLVSTNQTQRRG